MTRRRYIQIEGKLVEITDDMQSQAKYNDSGALWGDRNYDGLRAPDGTDISSRAKHQAYMKATGLTTADDFKSDWSRATEARAKYVQSGGSINRADIQRAIAKLQRG
jgi:hypothetical protein